MSAFGVKSKKDDSSFYPSMSVHRGLPAREKSTRKNKGNKFSEILENVTDVFKGRKQAESPDKKHWPFSDGPGEFEFQPASPVGNFNHSPQPTPVIPKSPPPHDDGGSFTPYGDSVPEEEMDGKIKPRRLDI